MMISVLGFVGSTWAHLYLLFSQFDKYKLSHRNFSKTLLVNGVSSLIQY